MWSFFDSRNPLGICGEQCNPIVTVAEIFQRLHLLPLDPAGRRPPMLARLAHLVARHRFVVIGIWLALTLFGGFAASRVSKRWYQSFSIPGKSAYEANLRTVRAFGVGIRPPNVVVYHTAGDATQSAAVRASMQRAAATVPGSLTSSWFSTHDPMFVSRDRLTTFLEVYPPGFAKFATKSGAAAMLAAAQKG